MIGVETLKCGPTKTTGVVNQRLSNLHVQRAPKTLSTLPCPGVKSQRRGSPQSYHVGCCL